LVRKRRLLTSAAVAALFAHPGYADTTIDSDTTTALTTGALLTTDSGTANAGNITIDSDGSIKISKASIGAITIDTSNYLYSNGTIKNSGESGAYGIEIDTSSAPNLTGASFTNASSATITGAGIYLDASSALQLTGDGTGKYGLYFDAVSGTGTYTGNVTMNGGAMTIEGASSYGIYLSSDTTFTGNLTMDSSSSITMTGGSSSAIYLAGGTTFVGNLTLGSSSSITLEDDSNTAIVMAGSSKFTGDISLGGSIVMYQNDVRSTTSSSLEAVLLQGTITGNLTVASGSSISVIGAGAQGMTLAGYGVTGAVTVAGTLQTIGYSSTYDSKASSYYTTSLTTYPEAGNALSIGANINSGLMISGPAYTSASTSSGTIAVQGTGIALAISPSYNSTVSQSSALTIGVYKYNGDLDTYDPGFSVYNRGTISAAPLTPGNSAQTIVTMGSEAYHTVLTGGFYNSGSIGASATTNKSDTTAVTATAISLGAYTYLDNATFDYATATWGDAALAGKETNDQAAFVNSNVSGSGVISASTSGYKAGAAVALYIAQYASVPSLINSGTITASALTSDQDLTSTISSSNPYTEYAAAIIDSSGTLTSIYNTGTIAAYAGVGTSTSSVTELDSQKQLAVAIDLSAGNTATPSGSGVTITERATATRSASIVGDIFFGTGDNQVIDIQGTSTTYTASIVGNIAYGATGANAIGDALNIGAYGIVKGKVTAGSGPGVSVNVASNGALYLLNDTTSLNAQTVHVADSGILSIGVSQSLTDTGAIASKGTVILDKGSKLYLSYNSFVPQGSNTFTLITAPYGYLQIDTSTIAVTNTYLTKNVTDNGYLPYLFKSANLDIISSASTGDSLVLHVTPKTSDELGLVGYAKQLFPYVNTALSVDNELGTAMIYGIHNGTEAQSAYSAFAPNVTGGDRAVAVSITDSATGPVAARQRSLLMYAHGDAGTSVWANEFVQMIKDPGRGKESLEGTRELSGFKDSGFGISAGVDTGSGKYGWFGGALTFYAGDVGELKRVSKTHEQWLILSGYSVWRGKGLFLNAKVDAGYGKFDGSRSITLVTSSSSSSITTYTRTADNKRDGALLSGAISTGAYLNYGAATLSPTFSVDGLMMRENGYTESNPGTASDGDAFNLKVQPYYARSLRAFMGLDARYDFNLGDFYLQPEVRAGYRYDFFSDPQKLKIAFAHADVSGAYATPGQTFTITGPDPAKGTLVLGSSIAATTEAWSLGFHFDFLRGSNGMIQEVGTLSIVGKI
jgi:hypothetical protein